MAKKLRSLSTSGKAVYSDRASKTVLAPSSLNSFSEKVMTASEKAISKLCSKASRQRKWLKASMKKTSQRNEKPIG